VIRTACVAAALLICTAATGSGQSAAAPSPKIDIELDVASSELPRRVSLFTALGEAANRGADIGLDRVFGRDNERRRSRVALRVARLWLVNLPIAALTTAASHNAGHFARINELEHGDQFLRVTHWPWPIPLVGTVEGSTTPLADHPLTAMAVFGGGEQGSSVLREQLLDKIYTSDRADYFEWVLVGYASLDFPMYAWTDLRPSHFVSLDAFFNTTPADFRNYVLTQAQVGGQPDLQAMSRFARQIRRSAWLNLADLALWSAVSRTFQYAATGERSTTNPVLSIGPLRIVPAAYSALGTLGLERGIDVRVIGASYLTHVTVRRTSIPFGSGRWGIGLGLRARRSAAIRPEGQVDIWRRLGNETGFRVEAGLRRALLKGAQPLETSFRIGYKSEGYLVDAPYRATVLASIATTIRF
jgi:hypothetical protein